MRRAGRQDNRRVPVFFAPRPTLVRRHPATRGRGSPLASGHPISRDGPLRPASADVRGDRPTDRPLPGSCTRRRGCLRRLRCQRSLSVPRFCGSDSNQRSTACGASSACNRWKKPAVPRLCGMNRRVAVYGFGRRTRNTNQRVPASRPNRGQAIRPSKNWAAQNRIVHNDSGPFRRGQATYLA